ncbi:MAG TPA: type II toxin-antitoxin system VapC family toxin [Actinophytocola sp.]|uniref:type II toxin-antitoxin system VapC family toxin n=1 Tax=Actinophytocola sp. TaxID=1872138 RepID=UPI002DDD445E|nr:type II toxin-antitoxin system VapC family toxin [Actinophytocola sp.]HEV2778367.1 type II toxin-antitoxin system VapC family toxin [Actinophytocola sp.]
MIYLDSNALVKLIREEDETPQLITWLGMQPDGEFVSSALVEVEVPRALRRNQPEALAGVAATLRQVSRVEIDAPIRATAAAYMDPLLRSLDAIHLATADHLVASGKHITAFVTYDKRLAEAASAAGLTVVAPGT